MLVRSRKLFGFYRAFVGPHKWKRNTYSLASKSDGNENLCMECIRNIGIAAHIDAGKTTTTERMLFYSGFTRVLGDVDDGDTIMDYMEQERTRGITITSAAITFTWLKHCINLIDTPGHVDFTMEVERSMRVLDGAVTVLDASAGVEAQSLTVWRQADRYGVPRIIYLNKMDKPKANIDFCLKSISENFETKPLLTQLPLFGKDGAFCGIVDLVAMERLRWRTAVDETGKTFVREPLPSGGDDRAWDEAISARRALVEEAVDLDDELAESVLTAKGDVGPSATRLEGALRRIALARTAVPVFCGSSFKNVGVQPLMDAVVKYLPSPADRVHDFSKFYGDEACALAFKITHDREKGRLTFLRVYSGRLEPGQRLYNAGRKTAEKVNRLWTAYADDFRETAAAAAGTIVVATGLKNVITGDTLVASQGAAARALELSAREGGPTGRHGAVLAGVDVPSPVFFCAIEPASLKYQKPLEMALEQLQIEDPSFTAKIDPDVGQTVIAGMGELHIEIIKDRLLKEFKVEADIGPLQVAYQETISETVQLKHAFERTIGNTRGRVEVHLSLEPRIDRSEFPGLKIGRGKDVRENVALLRTDQLDAVEDGVRGALASGPLMGFPVTHVAAHLHGCQVAPYTARELISAAASQCVQRMLRNADVRLLEPVMTLEIVTEEGRLGNVLADLSQRKGQIVEIAARSGQKIVTSRTPLSQLMGYSTTLRIISSGLASFSMEFHSYQFMTPQDQQNVIRGS